MSLFTSFISTLFLGPRDLETINNGGLTGLDDGDSPLVYFIDMNRFSSLSVHLDIGGSDTKTMTILGSNDEVAQASATYTAFDTDVFGGTSWTADTILLSKIPITVKWIKINITIAAGSSDNAVKLVARKSYR